MPKSRLIFLDEPDDLARAKLLPARNGEDAIILFPNGESRPSVWDTGHLSRVIKDKLKHLGARADVDRPVLTSDRLASVVLFSVFGSFVKSSFEGFVFEPQRKSFIMRNFGVDDEPKNETDLSKNCTLPHGGAS